MGYIKVAHREILRQLDYYSSLPSGWDKFVNQNKVNQNLIIKHGKNRCHCTNCNTDFVCKKKVNEKTKCPNCYNKYLIKRSNLKYYNFKDYLSILDKVDNTYIIRYFELRTIIDAEHKCNSSVVEFGREIPCNGYYRTVFVNDRVSKCQCHIYISHFENNHYMNDKHWREYTRNYSLIDYSIVFPNNIKALMQNTEYKYSCIWDVVKHSSYIDLQHLIKYNNETDLRKIEMLAKMKLYNLIYYVDRLNSSGSFQQIFGVSKDYYPFMKRNNITYKQLKLLKLLQEKDIKKIHYLEKFTSYGESTGNLEEISEYISLNRFIKYAKMHRGKIQTYIYKDYLRFAKLLGFDLKDNKYAFPKNLREEHDKLEKQYELNEKSIIRKAIKKRSQELSVNVYNNKKFIVFPAPSLRELNDEGKQQHHCVATYAEKYANGECDIYFMRDIHNKKKSLVTIEVKNNSIIQSRKKFNNDPDKEHVKFLQNWEKNVLNKAA